MVMESGVLWLCAGGQGGVEPAAAELFYSLLDRFPEVLEIDPMAAYGGKILGKIFGVLRGCPPGERRNRSGKEVYGVRCTYPRDVKRRYYSCGCFCSLQIWGFILGLGGVEVL